MLEKEKKSENIQIVISTHEKANFWRFCKRSWMKSEQTYKVMTSY